MDENADDEFEVTMSPDDTADRTPTSGAFFIPDDDDDDDDAEIPPPPPGAQAVREESDDDGDDEEEADDAQKDVVVDDETVERAAGTVDADSGADVEKEDDGGVDDGKQEEVETGRGDSELLVGAGAGGGDSGDDDDDDGGDDNSDDAAERKTPEPLRDADEGLDTRREAEASDDDDDDTRDKDIEKSDDNDGDDDADEDDDDDGDDLHDDKTREPELVSGEGEGGVQDNNNLADATRDDSLEERRAGDSAARATESTADTVLAVVGGQPSAPADLTTGVGLMPPEGADARFVDREEDFVHVFFRPTVRRERVGASSPSEPQEEVRIKRLHLSLRCVFVGGRGRVFFLVLKGFLLSICLFG